MSLTYKQQLEIQNKLMAAEYGIDQIIGLCKSNIKMYESFGKDGSSAGAILALAELLKVELDKKP